MYKTLYIIITLFFSYSVSAQKTYTIRGELRDCTGKMVINATIFLLDGNKQNIIEKNKSDSNGKFEILYTNLAKVSLYIFKEGFRETKFTELNLQQNNSINDLGIIVMQHAVNELVDIQVESKRRISSLEIDKRVFVMAQMNIPPTASSFTVLQTLPSISATFDGGLNFRGSDNVTIQINGKPINTGSSNLQTILDELPAGDIKSIELITNPSAQYDASGNAGIINIVLKENKTEGISASLQFNIGTNDKTSSGITLTKKTNNINITASYVFSSTNFWSFRENNIYTTLNDTSFYLFQRWNFDNNRKVHSARLNLIYTLTKRDEINFQIKYRKRKTENNSDLTGNNYDKNRKLDNYSIRYGNESDIESETEYNMGYERRFRNSKNRLSLNLSITNNPQNELTNLEEMRYNAMGNLLSPLPYIQQTGKSIMNKNLLTSLDYLFMLSDSLSINSGLRYVSKNIGNIYFLSDYDYNIMNWKNNFAFSNNFSNTESINAGYISLKIKKVKKTIQAGLRIEHSIFNSQLKRTGNTFEQEYFSLFPSVNALFTISRHQSIQVGYSRRISRPSFSQINPFVSMVDRFNYRVGNPGLRPEFINSFEASYQLQRSFSLLSTLFVRTSANSITQFAQLDSDSVRKQSWENGGHFFSGGLESTLSGDLLKRYWKINASSTLLYSSLQPGNNKTTSTTNSGFVHTFKLFNNFTLFKDVYFQLAGFYTSGLLGLQGKIDPILYADMAIRKSFAKGKVNLNVQVLDIFNTKNFNLNLYNPLFTINSFNKRESRIVYFGISFLFSKKTQNKKTDDNSFDGVTNDFSF